MLYTCSNISLTYKDGDRNKFALRDVSLSLPSTGLVMIAGASGSGKTSLLYLLSGIKKPTAGTILYQGEKLRFSPKKRRSEIGFVFQSSYLIHYLSVRDNVVLDSGKHRRAEELFFRLGISEVMHRKPHELSGGQKQRVTIARALMRDPNVILADEPTAALDHASGVNIIKTLLELSKNRLVAIVTHDLSMLSYADIIIHIHDGEIIKNQTQLNESLLVNNKRTYQSIQF